MKVGDIIYSNRNMIWHDTGPGISKFHDIKKYDKFIIKKVYKYAYSTKALVIDMKNNEFSTPLFHLEEEFLTTYEVRKLKLDSLL